MILLRPFITSIFITFLLSVNLARGEDVIVKPKVENGVAWHDVQQWGVEGRGWNNTKRYFDRLPVKAEGKVRKPVWDLSHQSAGMSVRFTSDASDIWIRYKLQSESLAMPHMQATGVSGMDLYARDEKGQWRWVAVIMPESVNICTKMAIGLKQGLREYCLYLPLYNGVDSLEIGVSEQAKFAAISPRKLKPLVFYGTSICQGGCASRPGMAWPSVVGRKLDRPIVNLGFSANGTMDASVGELLTELDAKAYMIDCLPNMHAERIKDRTIPLVKQIRKAKPKTPILLIEDRLYADGWIRPAQHAHNETNHAALRNAYEQLVVEGVKELYYVSGKDFMGNDNEGTVDGSHLTDLGMLRQAEVITTVLKQVLTEE